MMKKTNGRLIISVVACVLSIFLNAGKSQCQQMTTVPEVQKTPNFPGNIHLGPLKVHPGVSVTESYTSNIFKEEDHKKGAWISTVSPGIILQLPIRRHFLQLDYRADIIEAGRFHKQYDTDSHFVNGMIKFDFNRLNIMAGDNWQSNSTAPDSKNDIRQDYLQNRAFCDVSYRLANRYKVNAFYRNTSRQFDNYRSRFDPTVDPRWDNYMENDMGAGLLYRFLPVTSVLFEYGFTHRNVTDRGLPDTDRDSDSQRYWLGLLWEPTAKIVGTIKGGYYKRDYDGKGDWSGFAMEGDLKYKLSSHDTLTLKGFRTPLETSVTETHAPGFAPGRYGTYYLSTGGTLAYSHRFTYKISGVADISYFNDDYRQKGSSGKKREDDRFAAGIGAHYQIQEWLAFKVGYRYSNNDSNADNESYRENLLSAILSLAF